MRLQKSWERGEEAKSRRSRKDATLHCQLSSSSIAENIGALRRLSTILEDRDASVFDLGFNLIAQCAESFLTLSR